MSGPPPGGNRPPPGGNRPPPGGNRPPPGGNDRPPPWSGFLLRDIAAEAMRAVGAARSVIGGAPSTDSSCQYCPVCQLIAAFRRGDVGGPEPTGARGRTPRSASQVQRIDLDPPSTDQPRPDQKEAAP